MSLFKPEPPPAPKVRKGPPPPKPKPPPVIPQPEWNPAPPLKSVSVGEVCYLKVRIVQSVTWPMGPDMKDTPAVMVEILNGDKPAQDGRTDGVEERWLVTREQLVDEIRKAMERGAA